MELFDRDAITDNQKEQLRYLQYQAKEIDGLTQIKLGKANGITKNSIENYFLGINMMKLDTLFQLFVYFNRKYFITEIIFNSNDIFKFRVLSNSPHPNIKKNVVNIQQFYLAIVKLLDGIRKKRMSQKQICERMQIRYCSYTNLKLGKSAMDIMMFYKLLHCLELEMHLKFTHNAIRVTLIDLLGFETRNDFMFI